MALYEKMESWSHGEDRGWGLGVMDSYTRVLGFATGGSLRFSDMDEE